MEASKQEFNAIECNEEHNSKRQKTENKNENSSSETSVADDKITKENNVSMSKYMIDNEDTCILCMEAGSEEKQLMNHQCGQCAADAWKICVCCNETLLSRACPVCRSDYAPIILTAVPGLRNLFLIFGCGDVFFCLYF
jgi:hypothetical protein